ncbi:MAG: type II toxin-antitoxin system HicB family antitoxin [Chlamydiales bacterium]
MKREFSVIIEQDDDGYYIASVPELKGCHTQAKTLDTLMKRIREAVELCLEAEDIQETTHFIGIQRIAI